ncbi:MAG UNVERIFIED_CONTAM: hypothetical protein LVR18_03390 [Planctomycetaceae bacterium]|jgi:Na+/proline symporter
MLLAKNSFSNFTILSTIVASFVGGGTIIGVAEKSYMFGIGAAIGLMGFALQISLTGVMAPRIIAKFKNVISVGDIIGLGYGKNARIY